MNRQKLSYTGCTILFGLVLLSAEATDRLVVCVQNTTGAAASDLHVTFTGTGGNIYVDPLSVVAPGCPAPAVPSNGTVTNTALIDWGVSCVGAGATVTFVAYTSNGPLAVLSGFWTAGGTNIGPIALCRGTPPTPLPGGGPLGAMKLQVVCRPGAPPFYAGCMKIPGAPCWRWFCCIPAGTYWWRVIWCPYASPLFRLFETPPWFILTPWVMDGPCPSSYRWVRSTIPVPPPLPPFNPPIPGVTNGPPPFSPFRPRYPYSPQRNTMQVRFSEDGGTTFRSSGDFIQSFFDVFAALDVTKPDTNAFDSTFTGVLNELAPRYAQAGAAFGPLITELRNVETNPPSSTVTNIRIDIELIQLSLVSVSTQFTGGRITNPAPFLSLSNALSDLRLKFPLLGILPQRLNHAGSSLQLLADAYGYAATIVSTPPGVDFSATLQDNFLWALQNRALSEWPLAASAMMSHLRVFVPLISWSWSKSTIEPMRVRLQNSATGEILEDFYTTLSDASYFDIPYVEPEGLPVNIWFKLPTHLSVVLARNLQDGLSVSVPALVPGDVDGDNCVTSADLQAVNMALFTGGSNAVSVSSADVNGDGTVDSSDLNIVSANLGKCGQALPQPLMTWNYDNSGLEVRYPFDCEMLATPSLLTPNWQPFGAPEIMGTGYRVLLPTPLAGDQLYLRARGLGP